MIHILATEEEHEHRLALNGPRYYAALSDIEHLILNQNENGANSIKELCALKYCIFELVNQALERYPAYTEE